MRTMPDPFSSSARGVTEIPIREVISRLASLVGGPLTEYIGASSSSIVLAATVDTATADLDHLLTVWDDLESHRPPDAQARQPRALMPHEAEIAERHRRAQRGES